MMILLLLCGLSGVTSGNGCQSDRDKDHRPRVSCVDHGLTAVPAGLDPVTQVLVFYQNQFPSLSWISYSNFSDLQELDLSGNLIRTIEQSGPDLLNMRVLRLTNNTLSHLGPYTFSFTPGLTEVYLDGNGLRSLDEECFAGLSFVEVINLSHNKIQVLPPLLLERIPSNLLKTFDVEDNQIQQLPDGFFTSKPDIPYVYLSHNPWECSCQVGYLQSYLEDQEHNVYKHTGPISIENNVESVVCAAPATLTGRAIVNLANDDYCSQIIKIGDIDPEQSFTQLITALIPVTIGSVITKIIIPKTFEQTSETPLTTQPFNPMTTKPSTVQPTISQTQQPSLPLWINTSETASISTVPSTIQPTTTTLVNSTPLTTVEPIIPTTVLSSFWTKLESWTIRYIWTFKTDHHLSYNISSQITSKSPTSAIPDPIVPSSTLSSTVVVPPAGGMSSYNGTVGSVPWCWWLFISFLLLCILSAIFSCILFLWLIITYLKLYRPLKQKDYSTNAVTLMAYQVTADKGMTVDRLKEERVPFLPLELIRDVQPVYRSVLVITKGAADEGGGQPVKGVRNKERGEKPGDDDKIELVPTSPHERAEEARDGPEVFRKTLYRMISREEEIKGWMEVEASHWAVTERGGMKRDGGKTRYSLIIREEQGSEIEDTGAEWVVGEWEMAGGRGGTNQESWGSLIKSVGGPGLPDSIHTSTPQEITETQV